MKFRVAINPHYENKVKPGDGRFWAFNMSFQTMRLTLSQLLDHIRQGHAWSAPHEQIRRHRPTSRQPNYYTTYRVKENVLDSQLLALDCDTGDERSHFFTLLNDLFITRHAALLHATASSTFAQPRTRIIFLLDRPLDRVQYELALKALLHKYLYCDQSVNHAAVVFYGAKESDYLLGGALLPVATLYKEVIAPYQHFLERVRQEREAARARRLAVRGMAVTAHPTQIERYVSHVYQKTMAGIADLQAGTGARHKELFKGAVQLGALGAASWLTAVSHQQLQMVATDLLAAATANGYVADYGQDDTWRTIDNGLAIGEMHPYLEPVWYAERPLFSLGDFVEVVINEKVIAQGHIVRYRERAVWEYELDSRPRVWFSRNLLRQK